MFLETGEETATVDVLHYIWNGRWPANRSPRLAAARLDGKTAAQNIRLQPGLTYTAKLDVTDPDGDPLTYFWEIMEETTDLKWGGDFENKPKSLPELIAVPRTANVTLKAPSLPGAYRLFGYAFDGKGHAAHVNIPFRVEAQPAQETAGK
jgi:hypothetical protein